MKPIEPFGFFKPGPFGWTDCAETDDDAIPLYDKVAIRLIQKQRDELLEVFGLIIGELERKEWFGGNAPGHAHSIRGIWDSDNGALAGKPCAWCAVWEKAKELSAAIAKTTGSAA